MAHSIPTSALSHLEPRPGGQWTLTPQTNKTLVASYIMEDGSAISVTLHKYTTLKEVDSYCDGLIHKFTGAPELDGAVEHNRPQPSNEPRPNLGYPMLSPMHVILRPRSYVVNPENDPDMPLSGIEPPAGLEQTQIGGLMQGQFPAQPEYSFSGQSHQNGPASQMQTPGTGNEHQSQQASEIQNAAAPPMPWELGIFQANNDLLGGSNGMPVNGNQDIQGGEMFVPMAWEESWAGIPDANSNEDQQPWGMGYGA